MLVDYSSDEEIEVKPAKSNTDSLQQGILIYQ